ncbi:RagB/SusD family nutrient uptake outer membrane protein [Labilibaculum sp. A4]|uniref:RagB/SusD family nutrient uptake outer membrane protein n=1 Tax=Labilibaculum euxinus TaxID=2686357 RepID=UPI000F61998F|nr:RagB/SusD family nutrient uptake outer membrane protein [Labilibaculum euxinus]MDQ1771945.1 RagB/SusD family nutrient uptake outer membrane protein [Labilibaculum euxinus]MWN75705.1 RagB/SusD family nutrient uptake outer membrane protein [Labilibaculum euxinus]
MNKRYYKTNYIMIAFALLFAFVSCTDDLNTEPLDEDIKTEKTVFTDAESYKQLLAKCYAGLILGGQTAVDGEPDISSIDGSFSSYLRLLWNHQELPTDEAICAWNDGNLRDLHDQDWTASNEFVTAMYYRITLQITYCNNLIKLTNGQSEYKAFNDEARALRALSYYHMLDMFGRGPFVTEEDEIGSFFFPEMATQQQIFDYIESELTTIETELAEPGTNEYGRADKGLAWAILANMYLNSEVYIGVPKYTEAITYCNKIIGGGYSLESDYANLFLADNHLRTNEIIFPILSDGNSTQSWGGMAFILHSTVGGDMPASESGLDGGWGGNRTTKSFVNLFPDVTGTDKRGMFFTEGQNLEIGDIFNFRDGYALRKFKNITSTGAVGSNLSFPDTDFPLYRLADFYLIYAEAVVRGGTGGNMATAVGYINELRERAYGNASENITASDLTLDFILDERGRELYWECHRRTDLVRFGKLTSGTYNWPWKGAVADGKATDAKYNVFPIPSSDINANPNLSNISGY